MSLDTKAQARIWRSHIKNTFFMGFYQIKTALNVKTEKEAINRVLREFDTDILLADITFKDVGSLDFETVFED